MFLILVIFCLGAKCSITAEENRHYVGKAIVLSDAVLPESAADPYKVMACWIIDLDTVVQAAGYITEYLAGDTVKIIVATGGFGWRYENRGFGSGSVTFNHFAEPIR